MTATKPAKWKAAYSAWAVIGVRPDGTEDVLDVGRPQDVQQTYARLFTCPLYDSVHLRDLNETPKAAETGEVNKREAVN